MSGPSMMFPPPRNPDDLGKGPRVMGVTWTVTGLAVVIACLRMSVRKRQRSGLLIDDYLMFIAMLLQVAAQILLTVSFHYGMGKHDADLIMPDQMVQILKFNWLATAPGMAASSVARISIAILLVRLFGIHKWFKKLLTVTTTIQIVLNTVLLICIWAQTTPVTGMWEFYRQDTKRWDGRVVLYQIYLAQSIHTFADIVFVVVPVAFIWRLQMQLRRRLGLVFVMGLSLLTAIISIMKTVKAMSNSAKPEPDVQYKSVESAMYSCLEQGCVVLLGCIPPLANTLHLDFSRLTTLGHSIVNLIGSGSWNRSRAGKSHVMSGGDLSDGQTSDWHYEDVEMNNSRYKVNVTDTVVSHLKSQDTKATPKGQVQRVDEFTLTIEDSAYMNIHMHRQKT